MRARLAAACLALACTGALAQDGTGPGRYDDPSAVSLEDLLPEALIRSGEHRVTGMRVVTTHLVEFEIDSEAAGTQRVESIPLAVVRIHEAQTLAQATNQFEKDNQQFAEELRGQIQVGGDSIGDIIGSPLSTGAQVVGQFGRNVGQTFEELGQFPGPRGPGTSADTRPIDDPAFASYRRSIASQLSLDVYSTNPSVQRFLNAVARARMSGRARAGITTVSIARPPEVVVDGGRLQERIRSAVLNAEQSRLFERNATLLGDAGVPQPLVERLLTHPVLTPTHESAISEYVAFLADVANRAAIVEAALDADSEVEALGKVQIARMYAFYHETRAPLREMISGGHLVLALSREGTLLVALPFDLLPWTPETDRVFSSLAEFAERKGALGRAVLLVGNATPRARDALEQRGFQVYQRFLFRR